MIQVENLTKRYGARLAVNNLTFTANKGEIVGFLGPNGAGKTTTMRMLTGYMPASSGTAIVAGYDVFTQSLEARRRVGYLPESVPLYTDMSVWQYLDFMGELRGVQNREDKIEEVLDKVHLLERADSIIGKLSKGMRQRVGLAQAILHDPEVIILDEPTIGLDPNQVRDVRSVIQELGENRTVLFSTHILSEAQAICNRILIIDRGQIVAEDTTENLQMRFMGGQQLLLKVRGEFDTLAALLAQVPGVTGTAELNGVVTVTTLPGTDVRAEIARTVVENKFDLLEMRSRDVSLEEIYVQLLSDEHAATAAKEG